MTSRRLATLVASIAIVPILFVGCGSSDDEDSVAETTSTTVAEPAGTTAPAEEPVLKILVTNDDGVTAEGISVVTEALVALPNTEVTVVAPATQQSGQGGNETGGTLAAAPAKTAAGYDATAVTGFPADSIIYALDQDGIDFVPDLVVSGINEGQNLGTIIDVSGTVGAARAAARRGIPALASSSGMSGFDFETAAEFVTDWVEEHRDGLIDGTYRSAEPILLEGMNVPSCAPGTEVRGIAEVPVATTGTDAIIEQDCASTLADPTDDIIAFNNGFVSLSVLPPDPAPTTP